MLSLRKLSRYTLLRTISGLESRHIASGNYIDTQRHSTLENKTKISTSKFTSPNQPQRDSQPSQIKKP